MRTRSSERAGLSGEEGYEVPVPGLCCSRRGGVVGCRPPAERPLLAAMLPLVVQSALCDCGYRMLPVVVVLSACSRSMGAHRER